MKQVPRHPRDRLAPKNLDAKDEVDFVKQVPQHPRDRLARRIAKIEDKVEFVKQISQHSRQKLARKVADGKVKVTQKKNLLHPRERTIAHEKEIGANNSLALLENKNFDARIYLDKPLIFDLKKTSEEKIMERLIESIPEGNNDFYIEHM